MTAIKEALERAMDDLKFDDEDESVEASALTTTPTPNTEIVFNMIRAHGSMTGTEVRDELARRNYKWAGDASSYLNQLANRGLLSRARENTAEGYATNRFACLFPEYHRSVKTRKVKAKAKPVKPTKRPQFVPPTNVVVPSATNNATQAQAMVAGMSIGLAKAVYLELTNVFNVGT